MADMRLIVAGAGGRMGRALTRVISETQGAVLAGALEAPGSELLGKDAGVLAGLPANGIKLSGDLWALSKDADGILDFTVPRGSFNISAISSYVNSSKSLKITASRRSSETRSSAP